MTLTEARRIAEKVVGAEVYTPESLVRKIFNAFCVEDKSRNWLNRYVVYGDEIELGTGWNPGLAWKDALQNIPDYVLSHYERMFTGESVYYKRKEQNDEKEGNTPRASP